MVRRVIVAIGLVACWKPFGPPRPAQRAFTPRVQLVQLDNGLRVVALPDEAASEIQVTMQIGSGSIDDPTGRSGLAHLVEHLMFQQVVEGEALFAKLERHASSFNGFTELEVTTFTERATGVHLERFIAVEAARLALRCETIDEAAFVREREVVRNELRQKAEALEIAAAIHAGLFPAGHPYRGALDTPESVAAITREEACAFADAHYTPGNAVLVVSGDVSVDQVSRAARAAFEKIPRRARPPRALVPVVLRQETRQTAPIDSTGYLYGWPLPAEPAERARVRALAAILADHLDGEVRGAVSIIERGGERAPMIALAVVPAIDESLVETRAAIEREITELPTSFDNQKFYDDSFDHAQRAQLARLYATFEDGGSRDTYVAAHTLAGRDPAGALAEELHALASLERGAASKLARTALRLDGASVVTLQPASARRTGRPVELAVDLHGRGVPRLIDDPVEAGRPAPGGGVRPPAVTTRKLASGIRAVLLPAPGVPTVDIRVVFGAGTGDEPPAARGVAMIAAHALSPDRIDLAELIKFYEVGGTLARRVGLDHTTFVARGLASDFDLLLKAVEPLLHNGSYGGVAEAVGRMRARAFIRDPDAAIEAAWSTALYGPSHPYADAGVLRRMSFGALDNAAAERFRALHYRPDAMTVIIAGGFDPKLAGAWIDHQFAAWSAPERAGPARTSKLAEVSPAAMAVYEDAAMVQLRIALPAVNQRAAALLVAELVEASIADVRHQLGAAYSLSAAVRSARLSSSLQITGDVHASRAAEALALVRDRLAALRAPDRDTASRFVAARRRVMAALRSVEGSSAGLAAMAEHEVAAGREVTASFQLAERVGELVLSDLAPELGRLDLSRATILMRGPQGAVDAAYSALGLRPQVIEAGR